MSMAFNCYCLCATAPSIKHDVCTSQGIQGVRFKRLIMDEGATDRSPHPPQESDVKRAVFCSGKVCQQLYVFS